MHAARHSAVAHANQTTHCRDGDAQALCLHPAPHAPEQLALPETPFLTITDANSRRTTCHPARAGEDKAQPNKHLRYVAAHIALLHPPTSFVTFALTQVNNLLDHAARSWAYLSGLQITSDINVKKDPQSCVPAGPGTTAGAGRVLSSLKKKTKKAGRRLYRRPASRAS
jgi:hypothetical protein